MQISTFKATLPNGERVLSVEVRHSVYGETVATTSEKQMLEEMLTAIKAKLEEEA